MTRARGAHAFAGIVSACLFVHVSATPTNKVQLVQESTMPQFPNTSLRKSTFVEFHTASSNKSLDTTASPQEVLELWSLGGKHDLMKQIIRPETMQPYYFIPVSNSVKVLLQFKTMGIDLATTPRKPGAGAWGGGIMKMGSQAAFIGMALNAYKHDIQAWAHAGDILNGTDPTTGASYNNWRNRLVVRSLIFASSSNLPAGIAIWCSFRSHYPAEALGLRPKYSAIPVVGFPLSPFGASWLSPLKWLYAVLLAPYVFLGCLLYTFLTCVNMAQPFQIMCCHSPGCLVWCFKSVCALCMAELWLLWSVIKCTLWFLLCLVTVFIWSYSRSAWWNGYGICIVAIAYICGLSSWEHFVRQLICAIYAAPSLSGLCRRRAREPLLPQNEPAQPPWQQVMDAVTAATMNAGNDTMDRMGVQLFCPIAQSPLKIDDGAKMLFKVFDAERLQKDFDIDQFYVYWQQEILQLEERRSRKWCGKKISNNQLAEAICMLNNDQISMNTIYEAKITILGSVLKFTNSTMMLQLTSYFLAHMMFDQYIFYERMTSPWDLERLPGVMAKAFVVSTSERHFNTYFSSVLHAVPQEFGGAGPSLTEELPSMLLTWWRFI